MSKFNSLISNPEFMKKILGAETKEKVKDIFADEGVTITDEELKFLGESINEAIEKYNEIPEEKLDNISGGSVIRRVVSAPYKISRGLIEGAAISTLSTIRGSIRGGKRTLHWFKKI